MFVIEDLWGNFSFDTFIKYLIIKVTFVKTNRGGGLPPIVLDVSLLDSVMKNQEVKIWKM